jgi:hypothetical protein
LGGGKNPNLSSKPQILGEKRTRLLPKNPRFWICAPFGFWGKEETSQARNANGYLFVCLLAWLEVRSTWQQPREKGVKFSLPFLYQFLSSLLHCFDILEAVA